MRLWDWIMRHDWSIYLSLIGAVAAILLAFAVLGIGNSPRWEFMR